MSERRQQPRILEHVYGDSNRNEERMTKPGSTGTGFERFASDVYSQSGEDGVIAAILERLPELDYRAVEFGAWDGMLMSNTAALADRGWSRVLIEADRKRYDKLVKASTGNKSVVPIWAMVGWEDGGSTLDALLADTDVPPDFDVLSIDIDGNDYHVWAAVKSYRPKLVVIEFNPTIRNGIDYVQPPDPSVRRSSSITALARLGRVKGYELTATTAFNAMFVRDDLFGHMGVMDNSVDTLRPDDSWVSDVFFGFDGHAVFRGGRGLAWHGLEMPSDVRLVPRVFDGFPGDHSLVRRGMLKLWAAYKRRTSR